VVTTDKVYRNDNSGRAFIESDPLEGKDPYSASKVGTEAVISAWQQIAKVSGGPKVVSVRSGNVIGGGDFAENRLLPDIVRSVLGGESTKIRNPNSKRPWLYVLEPLIGYLNALENSLAGNEIKCVNFGPGQGNLTVLEILENIELTFPDIWKTISLSEKNNELQTLESSLLSLNSEFASLVLGWKSSIDQKLALHLTMDWWVQVENQKKDVGAVTRSQIIHYLQSEKE
jgi:CDP-glucose 4,6-dehydratase